MIDNGNYILTARETLRDADGEGLDGNADGAAGGDYTFSFTIERPMAVAGEYRVNRYTINDRTESPQSVASDDAGNYVVTWTSRDVRGFDDVYAQRYNASGIAQGSEFRVNTYTTSQQYYSTVAMDADGDFVVTWSSSGQDGSGWGVYAQRYNASGVAQGSEFPVNTTTAGNQLYSTLAMDADGDFVVTWTSYAQDGSGYGRLRATLQRLRRRPRQRVRRQHHHRERSALLHGSHGRRRRLRRHLDEPRSGRQPLWRLRPVFAARLLVLPPRRLGSVVYS